MGMHEEQKPLCGAVKPTPTPTMRGDVEVSCVLPAAHAAEVPVGEEIRHEGRSGSWPVFWYTRRS